MILETGPVLRAASFPDKLRPHATDEPPSLKARLALAERQIILEALTTCNGVKTRTAEFLGIDATAKWPGETARTWGKPIVMDAAVKKRVDSLWQSLGL